MLTENQLIGLCDGFEIPTQKANGEEFNNAEKRLKLMEYFRENGIEFEYLEEKLATTGSGRSKLICDALSKALPSFEYFVADTSLSESDRNIQNFFKREAEKTLRDYGSEIIEAHVEGSLQTVLTKITNKINEVVPSTEHVEPEINFNWSNLIQISFKSAHDEGNIPLHFRGDGFRRITMMSYFEYLAEQNASEKQDIIFGFEEPETFLHPSAQENLFGKLKNMSDNNYQVIVTTHSPFIVRDSLKVQLIHIKKEENEINVYQNIHDYREIVDDLGITLENQFISVFEQSRALLLVEGIDDCTAYNHVAQVYKDNHRIDSTFKELGIILIPIGGCGSIKHWITQDVLNTLGKPFLIYIDSDKNEPEGDSMHLEELLNLGLIEGINFLITRKRSLENYIPPDALNQRIPGAELDYDDWAQVKNICAGHTLAGQLGGRNVVEKCFNQLTYEELSSSYNYADERDEFMDLYELAVSKL